MKKIWITLALILTLLAAGCQQKPSYGDFPVVVSDVTFERPPRSVVSLSPSVTEQLFVLGYGGRVSATVEGGDFAPANALPTCGSFFAPDAAAVLAQKPEVVVASTPLPQYLSTALEKAEIPVVVLAPKTDDDGVIENLTLLATVFEGEQKAALIAEQLNFAKEQIDTAVFDGSAAALMAEDNNSPPAALWVYAYPEAAADAAAPEARLLEEMGLYNLLSGTETQMVTKEQLAALAPDYLFYSEQTDADAVAEGFKKSPAAAQERIFPVDMTAFESGSPRRFVAKLALAQAVFGEEQVETPNLMMTFPEPEPVKQSFFQKLFG